MKWTILMFLMMEKLSWKLRYILVIRCKGFNYGLGCFEGIRAYWNESEQQLYGFRMREHYERLLQSCKTHLTSIFPIRWMSCACSR